MLYHQALPSHQLPAGVLHQIMGTSGARSAQAVYGEAVLCQSHADHHAGAPRRAGDTHDDAPDSASAAAAAARRGGGGAGEATHMARGAPAR